MSLKGFHIVFIIASLTLAVGFGVWCLGVWRGGGEGAWLAGAVGAFAAAAALVVYGAWFWRKLRRWDEDAALRKTSPIRGGRDGDGGGPRAARHAGV